MEKETKERQSKYHTISSFFNCLVFVGMMVVSLIWDYRIINCDAKILCNVTEGYLNEVFSAICSVAVLGNAFLSLLFSSSDGKIRGITYRDILHHSSFGTQMLSTIILTTISILIAVFAYAKSLYTTLTFCLTADAILILISSIQLWNLLATEAFQSLAKVISSLRYDQASEINQSVFLKGDAVSYQLEIHYFLQNASSEECANFINSHRITEGTYLIGGIPYDYSRAMQYVRNNYMRETIDLDIHVAVDSNSGFIVDY